jgi:hypothetical protein
MNTFIIISIDIENKDKIGDSQEKNRVMIE